MHEEIALDAIAQEAIKKRKKKMTKKRQKGKLSAEAYAITAKVKKAKAKKKKEKLNKKELEINKKVESLREQRIKEISEQIKKNAKNGYSHIQISALWSDIIEMKLFHIVQEWAYGQGFERDTSYSEIYESPRSSDDLPSDTRAFLTISWE